VLKDLAYVGIGNDPEKDIQLKTVRDKVIKWGTGSFYLFYPVYKQCVVGFGKNSDGRLSSTLDGGFKTPAICTVETEPETSFKPCSIQGRGSYSVARGANDELYEAGRLESCASIPTFKKMAIKEKVRFVALTSQSLMVVKEDNTIWYKGQSIEYHFHNDESKNALTQYKLWKDKEKEEPIVDIASGGGFSLVVTESGLVWAWGNKFLDAIGLNSQEAVQLSNIPKGHKAKRVWAGQGSDHPVAFLELEEEATGVKKIFSAGKSEKGLLAQGERIHESSQFKEIKYPQQKVVYESISFSNESAMAIDTDGQLWGWGYNEHRRLGLEDVAENGIQKPFALYPLNGLGLKAKKVSCGTFHTLVLFEEKSGKQTLYSVGAKVGSDFAHLGVSEDKVGEEDTPFREIPSFSDREVADFAAHDSSSLVIVTGSGSPANDLYNHVLPDGSKSKGLLHFYKKGDKWEFLPSEQYEAKKADLPDICFAIKCPIADIASKDWPDLEALAQDILDDQISSGEVQHEGYPDSNTGEAIKGPLYHARCLVNHEEVECHHSESTIGEDDQNSLNPMIFIRIARKMKKGAKIPSIALDKFYGQDSKHGLDIEIIPDLTYEKNSALIKATQEVWDESLEHDAKFLPEYKKDLLACMDNKLSQVIADRDVSKISLEKDLKIAEI